MENITTVNVSEKILEILGPQGRLITMSKSDYKSKYPKNLIVFNANMCMDEKKIWYGDIDITVSREELQNIAEFFQKDIYILREMDARFEYENAPLIERFVYKVSPDKTEVIGEALNKIYQITAEEICEI